MHKLLILSLSAWFISTPALAAENLNSQLSSAVCRQQWSRAIRVVDRMATTYPEYRSELRSYRTRLVRIARSRVPAKSPDCAGDGLPRSGIPNLQLKPSEFPRELQP